MALSGIELRTAKACGEDWAAMQGGVRSRYCSACEKTVHDVAKMTPREMERLALRAVMGEEVCARLTRGAAGELVTLEARGSGVRGKAAGVVMAAAVAVGSAAAQEVKPDEKSTAVLTGRLLQGSMGVPFMVLRDEAGHTFAGKIAADGSFRVEVPPGTYDVTVWGDEASVIKSAVLHAGMQSVGDVQPKVEEATVTVGGVMAEHFGARFWLRHPVMFVKQTAYRLHRKFAG